VSFLINSSSSDVERGFSTKEFGFFSDSLYRSSFCFSLFHSVSEMYISLAFPFPLSFRVGNSDEDDGTSFGGDGGAGECFLGEVTGASFLLGSRYILSTFPKASISSINSGGFTEHFKSPILTSSCNICSLFFQPAFH
jgi:hypothetical protein